MKISRYWGILTTAILILAYFADAKVNHGVHLWVFTIVNLLLLHIARLGQVSWFHVFMTFFFFLGCWLKVITHHILDYPYVEPSGNFKGSLVEWQNYYFAAGVIGVALIVSKLFTLLVEARQKKQVVHYVSAVAVENYEWILFVLLAVIFYLVNNIFAFFVTGVNAKITLPFSLNAPPAFMALIGFSVVASVYLARDFAASQYVGLRGVLAILLISAIASLSMASRAAMVMQVVPMLIAAAYTQKTSSSRAVSLKPFILFGVVLLSVLVCVSIYRINVFLKNSAVEDDIFVSYALQSSMLVIDRWIGAEAIMVAISEPASSVELLVKLLRENPSSGVNAIYQILSGGKYKFIEGFTFLTLPGYFGVLGLSGSPLIIFSGVLLLAIAGMSYEKFIQKILFGQAICVALISAAVANSITQMSFPWLLVPFIIQMTVLVIFLHFTNRKNFTQGELMVKSFV